MSKPTQRELQSCSDQVVATADLIEAMGAIGQTFQAGVSYSESAHYDHLVIRTDGLGKFRRGLVRALIRCVGLLAPPADEVDVGCCSASQSRAAAAASSATL